MQPSPLLPAPTAASLARALSACSSASRVSAPTADPARIGEVLAGSGTLKSYLERKLLPDIPALLPAPPVAGSAKQAADPATYRATRAVRTTPCGALAVEDARLDAPAAAQVFACSAGSGISSEAAPHLYTLLRRTLADAGLSTSGAKDLYTVAARLCRTGTPVVAPRTDPVW